MKRVAVSQSIHLANGFREMATGDPYGDSVIPSSPQRFCILKPFIVSDGEVLGEHAQACYYCVNLRRRLTPVIKVDRYAFVSRKKGNSENSLKSR